MQEQDVIVITGKFPQAEKPFNVSHYIHHQIIHNFN